jgi:SAM-dependent methyltransferase
VARRVRAQELLVGIEGLALLRHLYDGAEEEADRRLTEVRRLLDDTGLGDDETIAEADARTGYAVWSESYDEPGNPIVAIEEPAVWSLLDGLAPGRSLDAPCGTGRPARRLAELGHEVVGIDLTPEMLRHARLALPKSSFGQADLLALPFPAATFDLVVSGLAIAHVADLPGAVGELSRVLRPGGRLILTALHPFQAHLGWHAPFADASGQRGFVREHAHTHADYLTAFTAAGLAVRRCVEPELGEEQVRAKRRAFRHIPEAALAAYEGLPGVVVWDVERTSSDWP